MKLSAEEIAVVEGLTCVSEYDKTRHILHLDKEFCIQMFEKWKIEPSKDTGNSWESVLCFLGCTFQAKWQAFP